MSRYPVWRKLFLQTSISLFFQDGPRTRPHTLQRADGSCESRLFDIWAPNTSHYLVSGRLLLQASISVFFHDGPPIIVFSSYGPRPRPAILPRGDCSYKRQFLCFSDMGPEHAPLPCVVQVVLTIVVFLTYGPRTRPATLTRGGCSYRRQFL